MLFSSPVILIAFPFESDRFTNHRPKKKKKDSNG